METWMDFESCGRRRRRKDEEEVLNNGQSTLQSALMLAKKKCVQNAFGISFKVQFGTSGDQTRIWIYKDIFGLEALCHCLLCVFEIRIGTRRIRKMKEKKNRNNNNKKNYRTECPKLDFHVNYCRLLNSIKFKSHWKLLVMSAEQLKDSFLYTRNERGALICWPRRATGPVEESISAPRRRAVPLPKKIVRAAVIKIVRAASPAENLCRAG